MFSLDAFHLARAQFGFTVAFQSKQVEEDLPPVQSQSPPSTIKKLARPMENAGKIVGAVVLIPLILCYSGFSYWVFRGKVQVGAHYH